MVQHKGVVVVEVLKRKRAGVVGNTRKASAGIEYKVSDAVEVGNENAHKNTQRNMHKNEVQGFTRFGGSGSGQAGRVISHFL